MSLPVHLMDKILSVVPQRVVVASSTIDNPRCFLSAHEACLYIINDHCDIQRWGGCSSYNMTVCAIDSSLGSHSTQIESAHTYKPTFTIHGGLRRQDTSLLNQSLHSCTNSRLDSRHQVHNLTRSFTWFTSTATPTT